MKRSKTKVDIYRGLVPDHIRINWLDEEFEIQKSIKCRKIFLKWPGGKIEAFASVLDCCSQHDISNTAIAEAIAKNRHISVIEGHPKAFYEGDKRMELDVEEPTSATLKAIPKRVVVTFHDGEQVVYRSVYEAAERLAIHKQTIMNAIHQKRPIKNGVSFKYEEVKK